MFNILLPLLACALCAGMGIYTGYKAGWNRCLGYEPRKSIDLMEQENKMIIYQARYADEEMKKIHGLLQPVMSGIEAGMYKTYVEKQMLTSHASRMYFNTCERIMENCRHLQRTGPWTTEKTRNFLGSVLDAVFTRNITIAAGVEDIMKHVYIDAPNQPYKVPVQQV